MAKLPFSISEFNKNLAEIASKGYTYPTQQVYLSTIHSRIIVPPELAGSGRIRTYNEAVQYAKKLGVDLPKFYSYEDYIKELKELKEELGKSFTPKGFYEEKREDYKAQIEDAFEREELEYDIDSIPTEVMRDLLNEAWHRAKADSAGSPTFYEHLMEVVNEWFQG